MATRSNIAHLTDNGWEFIYCHWNGTPDANGSILLNHYKDSEKVAALISLGDISSLHENLDDVLAYHRWRGEFWDSVKPQTIAKDLRGIPDSLVEEEWCYAWDGERWWVRHCSDNDWVELTPRFILNYL